MSRSIDPSSVLINENVERFAVLASRVPCTLLSAGTRFALISALTFRPKAAEYKKEGGTNTSKTKNTYMALETKPLLPLRMPDYAPDCIMLSRLFEQSVGRAGISCTIQAEVRNTRNSSDVSVANGSYKSPSM